MWGSGDVRSGGDVGCGRDVRYGGDVGVAEARSIKV